MLLAGRGEQREWCPQSCADRPLIAMAGFATVIVAGTGSFGAAAWHLVSIPTSSRLSIPAQREEVLE